MKFKQLYTETNQTKICYIDKNSELNNVILGLDNSDRHNLRTIVLKHVESLCFDAKEQNNIKLVIQLHKEYNNNTQAYFKEQEKADNMSDFEKLKISMNHSYYKLLEYYNLEDHLK